MIKIIGGNEERIQDANVLDIAKQQFYVKTNSEAVTCAAIEYVSQLDEIRRLEEENRALIKENELYKRNALNLKCALHFFESV